MTALYNEIEPYAVQWLRNLSDAGHIARGEVDARSIKEVGATDLLGARQAHFFAGIGVWSYALRLAGWPDDAPVWTGSCPCQPFSTAGRGGGFDDDRHLWPEWFRLIRECRPPVVFGEQVASPDGYRWLDLVSADLEGAGYAFGAAVLPAAGVGAPHLRHRTFFVAYTNGGELGAGRAGQAGDGRDAARLQPSGLRATGGPAHTLPAGRAEGPGRTRGRTVCPERRRWRGGRTPHHQGLEGHGGPVGVDGAEGRQGPQRHGAASGVLGGFWSDAEWLPCRDGKWRPVEPGTFPLAHGAPGRVGRLRAYGNAINPQTAAAFVRAAMESGVRP